VSITDRQKAALTSRSPKTRNSAAPDPQWKLQQAFIRATRRGSKKRTTMEERGELLLAATEAIKSIRLVINPLTGKPTAPSRMPIASNRVRAAADRFLSTLTKKE